MRERPLYHAAAVLASNNLAALIGIAADLLVEAGVPPDDAVSTLLPLARGTLANIEEVGLHKALTGPAARGDTDDSVSTLRDLLSRHPDDLEARATLARVFGAAGRSAELPTALGDLLEAMERRGVLRESEKLG